MPRAPTIICHPAAWMILATALLPATGCHTAPARTPAPATRPDTQPTDAAPLPDKAAVHATDLFTLRRLHGAYDISHDTAVDRAVPYTLETDDQGGWVLTIGTVRKLYLRQDNDGAILVPREDQLGESLAITYLPPIQMLPSTLVANHPVEFDTQVTIRNLKDGSIRDKGDCHYSVELLGRQRVQTPAGDFNAYMVRSVRQMNLNLASVKVTILGAYAPGQASVLQRVEQVRRLLGLFSSRQVEESRLVR